MPSDPTAPDPDEDVAVPRRTLIAIAVTLLGLAGLVAGLAGVDLGDLPGGPDPTTPPTTSTSTTSTTSTSTSTTTPPAGDTRQLVNYVGLDGLDDADGETPADEVDRVGMTHPEWTQSITAAGIPADNGPSPDGQFRLNCHIHHLSNDDPVVFPDQPGRAHLHQFFGNTLADASSTLDSLLATGDSSCQGGPNNRSAYWAPAMLDGDGNFIPPEIVLLYYKSKQPGDVIAFPPGTQLLAGTLADGVAREEIQPGSGIVWGCYNNGRTLQQSRQIPGTPGTAACPSGWPIALDIQFPECMAINPDGTPRVTSLNLIDHAYYPNAGVGQLSGPCPDSHPIRLPQITYKFRWANPAGDGEADWRLSSDHATGDGQVDHPGGSAHGDWFGAWSEPANDAWLDGCYSPPRNCSQGQTGGPRRFAPFTGEHIGTRGLENQLYIGPREIPLPEE